MESLMAFVKENHLDAGVAFDGDADRCLAVDNQGNLVDGDFVMAICALDMKSRGKLAKNTVVGTIMTNMGFIRFCEENGMNFVATKAVSYTHLDVYKRQEFGGILKIYRRLKKEGHCKFTVSFFFAILFLTGMKY